MLAVFMRRGDEMLAVGNISAARLLYERAAEASHGPAALALARTYDPAVLAELHAVGMSADVPLATKWYKRALGLGMDQARAPLARLERKPGH